MNHLVQLHGNIRFAGDKCEAINCAFKDLKGKDKFETNIHGYGIQIHNGWVTTFNNSGNTYENCNIYNLGNQAINESKIKNCNVYMLLNTMSGTAALNKCNFENGKFMCYTKITLVECQLKNIEYTWGDAGGDSIKIIKNSNVEGTFKSLAFDNDSIIDNSTIIAKNKLASDVFNNVQFKNLSKIILRQNKGTYNIKNLQSVLGKDYTVQLGE